MQCRNCGTEIADKAIVCYRCGTATTDPVRKAVPIKPRRPFVSFVVAALLLLSALYMGYAAPATANPDRWQTAAGVMAGAALLVLLLRLLGRRGDVISARGSDRGQTWVGPRSDPAAESATSPGAAPAPSWQNLRCRTDDDGSS